MPRDELAEALRECSFHPLLILVSRALARSGYGDVELAGRRRPRQRSRRGGHEISCVSRVGDRPLKVLVKVVHDDDLRTRMTDEMVGVLARERADLGLVVTPRKVSAKVAANQALYLPARVETMDGEALAGLMRRSGVAVRPDGSPDYAFLSALEETTRRMRAFMDEEGL